jgi:hypothetical protein
VDINYVVVNAGNVYKCWKLGRWDGGSKSFDS